jgi:dynein heavy chain
VRQTTSGCHQGTISAHDLSYSEVCGKIIAYQVGSPDAFDRAFSLRRIDDNYVDGISLTHGSPRQHIWTFAAGNSIRNSGNSCPCISGGTPPPSFVGEDYFCETANKNVTSPINTQLYLEPLWDGAGCGTQNACCSFNTPPWFYKQLPQPTTDDIEMRVCTNEPRSNEDIAIQIIDIYIQ